MKLSSRRDFLKYIIGFFGFFAGCSREQEDISNDPVMLGPINDFLGKSTVLSLYRVTIFSDDSGLRAVNMVCTHQFCGINRTANGFSCPCHGSKFSNTGEVLRGPATKTLNHLKLSISNKQELLVWPREQVDMSWRLLK